MPAIPCRVRPCRQCPWVKTTEPGQFTSERYEALRGTTGRRGNEAPFGAGIFACHKSIEGKDVPCAGWLASVGYESLTVRVLVCQGVIQAERLIPGDDWPELFTDYDEMSEAMGSTE